MMFWPHYEVKEVNDMEAVRQVFLDDKEVDFTLNWLFLSTSGVHGSYATLDEIEKYWDLPEDSEDYVGHYVTVLIIHPRLVAAKYGSIQITKEDVPYLRKMVSKTLEGIRDSQMGNKEV